MHIRIKHAKKLPRASLKFTSQMYIGRIRRPVAQELPMKLNDRGFNILNSVCGN